MIGARPIGTPGLSRLLLARDDDPSNVGRDLLSGSELRFKRHSLTSSLIDGKALWDDRPRSSELLTLTTAEGGHPTMLSANSHCIVGANADCGRPNVKGQSPLPPGT